MIAADSSSLISFLEGDVGADVKKIISAASSGLLILPPVVLAEILSAEAALATLLSQVELLDITDGYWKRAGASRRLLRQKGLKALLGDTLIAQSCIDHDIPLITSDPDFRHFAKYCGLKLA